MFCDLVGSTALSGRLDPEELRDLIAGLSTSWSARRCAQFDGFVAKYMGDGVLTYFGWPAAHEDDAERAVRAGLAIVDAVRALRPPQASARKCASASPPDRSWSASWSAPGRPRRGGSRRDAESGGTSAGAGRAGRGGHRRLDAAAGRRRCSTYATLAARGEGLRRRPVQAWRVLGESRAESRFEACARPCPDPAGRPRRGDRSAAAPLGAGQGRRGPGRAAVRRARHRQVPPRSRVAQQLDEAGLHAGPATSARPTTRTARSSRSSTPASGRRSFGAGRPRTSEARQAGGGCSPRDRGPAGGPSACSPRCCPSPPASALPAARPDPAAAQGRGRWTRWSISIEGLARRQPVLMLFEDAHWVDPTTPGAARPADRPRAHAPAAGGRHPPAGVSAALDRPAACRRCLTLNRLDRGRRAPRWSPRSPAARRCRRSC